MRAVAALLVLGAAVQADDDPVPALLVRLESGKPVERAVATRTLGRLDDTRALAAVLKAQEDGAPDVRHEAAIALAKAGKADAATVSILAKSLEDRDWYVRWQAAVALKRIGPKAEAALPALAAALGNGTVDVSREAALALATIAPRDERTVAALVAAIEGGLGDRAAIFHAVGMCGKAAEPAIPALVRELKNPVARTREQAFAALRAIASATVAVYAELLDTEDPGMRVFGARGLAGVRSGEAFFLLAHALRDRVPAVRVAAASAAKEMGKSAWSALPALVPLLADEKEDVRIAAAEAMTAAGAPDLALLLWGEYDAHLGRRVVPKRWPSHHFSEWARLQLEYTDDPEALFGTLSDKDVGAGILRAFSTMGLAHEQASLEACLFKGSLASRRCAALMLPYIAGDKARAARALRKASEDLPDLKDLAEAGLRELAK